MRIIGDIQHPVMKITAFKMNDKISVKLEHELIEHIIKFRSGSGIDTLEDIQNFLTDDILNDVLNSIVKTATNRSKQLLKMNKENDELSFPTIL